MKITILNMKRSNCIIQKFCNEMYVFTFELTCVRTATLIL